MGLLIISDTFTPYFNLNNCGYIHFVVNILENFVDLYSGAHTNTIEGVWGLVKQKLKAMNGTHSEKMPGYLDEFNLWKVYAGDHFHNIQKRFQIR